MNDINSFVCRRCRKWTSHGVMDIHGKWLCCDCNKKEMDGKQGGFKWRSTKRQQG